jgi:hypothetical protein
MERGSIAHVVCPSNGELLITGTEEVETGFNGIRCDQGVTPEGSGAEEIQVVLRMSVKKDHRV